MFKIVFFFQNVTCNAICALYIEWKNNIRLNVAGVIRNYLDEVGINTMVRPARSPDLNPIDKFYDSKKGL